MSQYLLAIDQGTTSSRAMLFNTQMQVLAKSQQEFSQFFPKDGWVEHDAEEIWQTILQTMRDVVSQAGIAAKDILAIGITNQRETSLIWDKESGEVLHRAIVWQDRRTAQRCADLRSQGLEAEFTAKTGLLLDPYFSGTKLEWLLDNVEGARELASSGRLAFGTVDSFLLWRLTGGKVHATDPTNASRTLLYNIHTQAWDESLLKHLNIPEQILPNVQDSNAHFGETSKDLLGESIPICGIAGDQQAAMVGQACFHSGMIKSTYGTGCFVMLNTGREPVQSRNRLLTTIGYRINGETVYGLEGSIFIAGAAVQWLRDKLELIAHASETESLAKSVKNNGGVYFVPALTGLGAPYWDPHARGAIVGLTRDSRKAHIVRAALEAVCYQTRDLLECMTQGFQHSIETLRVDGGMVENDWLMQFLSNILNIPVQRAKINETTAMGAAMLAGLGIGVYKDLAELESLWQAQKQFKPTQEDNTRDILYQEWQQAIKRVLL